MRKSERIALLERRTAALEEILLKKLKRELSETLSAETSVRIQPEIGKWYIIEHRQNVPQNAIAYCNTLERHSTGNYGFDHSGRWMDGQKNNYGFCNVLNGSLRIVSEIAFSDLLSRLSSEAKRRGLVSGAIISPGGDNKRLSSKMYRIKDREFFLGDTCIMCNGFWAEPVNEEPEPEQDKFAELKEAHRNGAVIQCKVKDCDSSWVEKTHEEFIDDFEYRIKPEEKPKVGDVCKFWDDDENDFIIDVLREPERRRYFFTKNFKCIKGEGFINAKPLTKQDAINLLFGDGKDN